MEIKNQIFTFEIEAMKGAEMPEGLEHADQLLFLKLRMLYFQYRKGIIDREAAKREKRLIVKEHEKLVNSDNVTKLCVEHIKKTELARAEYRKNKTLENADKILACLEGRG